MEDRLSQVPDLIIYETFYKRLTDTLTISGKTYDGNTWWIFIIPILILAAFFVGWMYVKDSRSIRWFYALPLGLMRLTVYGLLTYMFLLPSLRETKIWKPRTPPVIEKKSRVAKLWKFKPPSGKFRARPGESEHLGN